MRLACMKADIGWRAALTETKHACYFHRSCERINSLKSCFFIFFFFRKMNKEKEVKGFWSC